MTSPATRCVRFTYAAGDGAGAVVIDLEGTAPGEHILGVIRTQGTFYESDLLEHLARQGPRGGVYVDVGANIGNHSVFFGRFLADRVVAIEPDPDLRQLLERNLKANAVAQWTTLPVAIGARPGTGRLCPRHGYEGNAGAQQVVPFEGGREGPTVEIETLDGVLAELGPHAAGDVRLVKLDIEGMELDALHGAVGLLEGQQPDLVVEAAGDAEHAGVCSLLAGYGYREIARFCRTPTYHFANPARAWTRGPAPRGSEEQP